MQRMERVILKASGELFGNGGIISFEKYDTVARQVVEIRKSTGAQMAMVVGGGNIFRGRNAQSEVDSKVDPVEADQMGMLATIMNGIGLREALQRNGAKDDSRLMVALEMPKVAEPYLVHKARKHLDDGMIVVIAGGTGSPGCTTDTAVAQYAWELQCDMILKASTVDGVYDKDPHKFPEAKRYETLSFRRAIEEELGVMDATAFTMCNRWEIPIFVFDIKDLEKLPRTIKENDFSFGTLITRDGKQE